MKCILHTLTTLLLASPTVLPAADAPSRAIVAQMKADEERHADEALDAGGTPLPQPLPGLMRLAARVMTGTAHYL